MGAGRVRESAEQPLLPAVEDHELRMPLDPDQERLGGAFDRLNDLVLVARNDLQLLSQQIDRLVVKRVNAIPAASDDPG